VINMGDTYLEKLRSVQDELVGIDKRLDALESGFVLTKDQVDAFVELHRKSEPTNYEYFLSPTELEIIADDYEKALGKGPDCDAWDYGLAALIGVFCGIIDAFFFSTPHEGLLSKGTDNLFDEFVKWFARKNGWSPREGKENSIASAIGHLERHFRVGYDQTTGKAVGDKIKNLSMSNHHAKSAAHYPDIFGLVASICNQFTNTSTFYDNNRGTITIVEGTGERLGLQGNSLSSKIYAGTINWIGHCMSDIAGSSGSKGAGTGLPIPFTEFFQFCNFGRFPNEKGQYQTFATVMTKVYEEGYDARHGAAMTLPVLLGELMTKATFVLKQRFFHEREWQDVLKELKGYTAQRMLTVSMGTMCMTDLAHAAVTSWGQWTVFFSKLNLIAWARFGVQGVKELQLTANKEIKNMETIQDEISTEWDRLLVKSEELIG